MLGVSVFLPRICVIHRAPPLIPDFFWTVTMPLGVYLICLLAGNLLTLSNHALRRVKHKTSPLLVWSSQVRINFVMTRPKVNLLMILGRR